MEPYGQVQCNKCGSHIEIPVRPEENHVLSTVFTCNNCGQGIFVRYSLNEMTVSQDPNFLQDSQTIAP